MELYWEEFQDAQNVSVADQNSTSRKELTIAVDTEMMKISKTVIQLSNWLKLKDSLGNDSHSNCLVDMNIFYSYFI